MRNFLTIMILIMALTACKTDELMLKKLDVITSDKYYSTDIIPDSAKDIYGTWKVLGTSGGFTGMGYKKDFDYLLLKPNAIFGIVRNDSLIGFGKLSLNPDNTFHINNSLVCKFEFDQPIHIELSNDSEKDISLINNDTMNLTAPCCDRYNTQLIRYNSDWYNASKPGTLRLKISIGPLCPVETVPPQPGCKPTFETYKAWQTAIWNSTKTQKILDVVPNLDGTFNVNLSEGNYVIDFVNSTNKIGKAGLPKSFTITHNQTTDLSVNIDTGIR